MPDFRQEMKPHLGSIMGTVTMISKTVVMNLKVTKHTSSLTNLSHICHLYD